jgi:hypothetical protein
MCWEEAIDAVTQEKICELGGIQSHFIRRAKCNSFRNKYLEGRRSIRLSYGGVNPNFSYYKRFRHFLVSSALRLSGMDRRLLSAVQSLRYTSSCRRILAEGCPCLSRHCCGKSAGVCPVHDPQGTCSGSELSPIAAVLFAPTCEKM